jgi:hypothetical protein
MDFLLYFFLAPLVFLVVIIIFYVFLFPLILKTTNVGEIISKRYKPFFLHYRKKLEDTPKTKEDLDLLKTEIKRELEEIKNEADKDIEEDTGFSALKAEFNKDIKDIFK